MFKVKLNRVLATASGSMLLCLQAAVGQYDGFSMDTYSRNDYRFLSTPTFSPYLNLAQDDTMGVSNYHLYVLPQVQQQEQNRQIQYDLSRLENESRQLSNWTASDAHRLNSNSARFTNATSYPFRFPSTIQAPAPIQYPSKTIELPVLPTYNNAINHLDIGTTPESVYWWKASGSLQFQD